MSTERATLRAAYKRAGIGLAVVAVVWLVTYLKGWEERNLLIPIGAAGLSALCFSLYFRSKEE